MFRRRNILILQNRTTIIPFLSSKYFYYKFSIPKKKKKKRSKILEKRGIRFLDSKNWKQRRATLVHLKSSTSIIVTEWRAPVSPRKFAIVLTIPRMFDQMFIKLVLISLEYGSCERERKVVVTS